MPRLNELADVLFPVEVRPVFAGVNGSAGERPLPIPDKKAIVDTQRRRVLGVVSRDYHLVTNSEALDWGYQCCRTTFPETNDGEWEVTATDAPATRGHCFIDLVHNSTALDFSVVPTADRPDAFGPFIRVTNSYNGLRALTFNIGFFRKVCKNGMILPDTIITFKFAHLQRNIREAIEFRISHSRLATLKASFGSYIVALRALDVDPAEFEPVVRAALVIQTPKSLKEGTREAADWDALTDHIAEMGKRYTDEVGANAYAVLNVITEFASHPPVNRYVHRGRHSLQRLAGAWVSDFSKRCKQPGFTIPGYLSQIGRAVPDDEPSSDTDASGPSRGQPIAWHARSHPITVRTA